MVRKIWKRKQEEVSTEIDETKTDYRPSELEAIADAWLREDARSELCRECKEDSDRTAKGEETGYIKAMAQFNADGKPVTDQAGNHLHLDFPEIKCPHGHTWFQGEGIARGIGGEDPILFEEHFQSRKRREIYTAEGTPDPNIVSGLYNRSHPQGRKVNSAEQRAKNGASYYR